MIELLPKSMNMDVEGMVADRKIRSPQEGNQLPPAEHFRWRAHERFEQCKRLGGELNPYTPYFHFAHVRIQLDAAGLADAPLRMLRARPTQDRADSRARAHAAE